MRTIVAGIDEAGFGPVLGPLVVSTTVFEVPSELMDMTMWDVLAASVCRKPSSKRRSLVPIADSKKLYSGLRDAGGVANLERGVLAMLGSLIEERTARSEEREEKADFASRSLVPATLADLLTVVSPSAASRAQACPWYSALGAPLPHCLDREALALDVNSLQVSLGRAEIVPLAMRSEIVFESEFNRLVRLTDNKSALLFDVAARLLALVWAMLPRRQGAHIFIDHQGGRVHYREALMRVFEGCQLKINDETETRSSYTLLDAERTIEIDFLVQAEDRHLPVALASMLSKYLRELFMTLYNRYWASHLPDLAPTAGYYTDGRRFFTQIQPLVESMGLDVESLYRSR